MNLKVEERWMEELFLVFLVVGFILSVLLNNAVLSYLCVLFGGAVAGRIYYFKYQKEPIFPFILIIIGFLLGYLIGSIWTSRVLAFIFFGIGFGISYYLHLKKILVRFKSKSFVK
ncbi:MAG: hypothetical protein KKH52_02325 [Nanoarchaeota archaeon]|nr:hypothetical protein [Nanoarchaeota archaeon]MBU1623204.1 hypothetical protein [Nanoarchaeota archaeon]MBU1974208.1 hypothetical protein [Nanoarchaeota archaeon]